MKQILFILIFLIPAKLSFSMEFEEARHLLNRTGFGASLPEIQQILPLEYEVAVDQIVDQASGYAQTKPPIWIATNMQAERQKQKNASKEEKKAFRKKRKQWGQSLKAWWYQEMLETQSPLRERMTLFWHNHFTSSLQKVKNPIYMYRQNLLLREHAVGNFYDLLHQASTDPAMILYLDNQTNRKGKPNENFAREVLELFTMGEGHGYTEEDIREAARAFTGWKVNQKEARFYFAKKQHDSGLKTFMGKTGRFQGEDILEIILHKPRVSVYLVEKLWREFISDTPDSAEVTRLAIIFRQSNYEIKQVLKELLKSSFFRDPENRGAQIKSPTDLIVGTLRTLEISMSNPKKLNHYGRSLGQDLMNPPNVKGWPGGEAWINSNTLLLRKKMLQDLLHGKMISMNKMEAQNSVSSMEVDLEDLQPLLLAIDPVEAQFENQTRMQWIQELLLDPAYQLK